jgi:hypothetical protein
MGNCKRRSRRAPGFQLKLSFEIRSRSRGKSFGGNEESYDMCFHNGPRSLIPFLFILTPQGELVQSGKMMALKGAAYSQICALEKDSRARLPDRMLMR